MILITSGAYICQEFAAEVGIIPPSFLPVSNKRLYEHQISLLSSFDRDIYISLSDAYCPVAPGSSRVALTAEKKELSKFCCTGLYMWKNYPLFAEAFGIMQCKPLSELDGNEYYIAPMYNYLIDTGGDVRFSVVERKDVIFCGVPEEYNAFLRDASMNLN